MAFPFLSETGFESGTLGHFDVETDTETRLDFPHYTELARIPNMGMPFRGAYCMRVNLANDGTPADAYVQETGSWDTGADGTIFFRFQFWISRDLVMANNDEFALFQLWSGASTVEGGVYVNFTTANGFRVGVGETSASQLKPLTLGQWHTMEIGFNIDAGGGNDGTIDAWLDNAAYTQITGLDQAAITSGVLGVLSQDAGTTTGVVLFDEVIADDARIFPPVERFQDTILMTTSGHVFVGEGTFDVTLLSGAATDCVASVFDTDLAYTSDASNLVVELKNIAANESVPDYPRRVQRGCYVSLSGTNPRALVTLRKVMHYSSGAMRGYGLRRVANPLGA